MCLLFLFYRYLLIETTVITVLIITKINTHDYETTYEKDVQK